MGKRDRHPPSRHDDDRADPLSPSEDEAIHVPARVPNPGGGEAAPIEGLETAMKMQAEILKRLHDRQEEMGKALTDSRRSEMMIQSTRALNDSFSGMQRVQQGLMDKISEDASRRRFGTAALVIGVLAVAGALVWGAYALGDQVEKTGRELASQEPKEDPAARAALGHVEDLRERLKNMESRDQALFLDRLDKLRDRIQELEGVRLKLESERDVARAAVDAEAADVLKLKERLESVEQDLEASRKDGARLTAQALADQKLIRQLNDVIATLKTPGAAAPVAVNGSADEAAPGPEEVAPAGDEAAPGGDAGEKVAADPSPPAQVDAKTVKPAMLSDLNTLLQQSRSSDVYEIVSATSFDSNGLTDVVLEVRGRNGSLAKVVRAEKLAFTLSATGTLLELDFEVGHVEFRQGVSRIVKSPFFNDRYEIVVLGVSRDAWVRAGYPFLRVK